MAQNRCRKDIVGKRFLCVPACSNQQQQQQINGHPTSLLPGLEPSRWAWRAGVIRAATHHSLEHLELQLLLEYDDQSWDQREWTNIHQAGVFHVFLIEHDLWWAQQSPSHHQQQYQLWPALAFSSLVNRSRVTFRVARLIDGDICVDKDDNDLTGEQQQLQPHQRFKTVSEATSGISASATGVDRNVDIFDSEVGRKRQLPNHVRTPLDRSKDHNSTTGPASRKKGAQTNSASVVLIAVEFLLDQQRAFLTPSKLLPFQDWEAFGLASIGGGVGDWSQQQQKQKQQQKEEEDRLTADTVPAVKEAVRKWAELQAGQRILVTTPSVVVGYRCQVYRSEGATQWYTAVIVGHNEETGELTLTDDTVLEEHYEDPRLLQIKLLGEGVVESILRGETVGITSRRSRASSQAGKVYQLHQQQQQQHHNNQQVGGLSQAQQHPSTASSGNKRSGKEVRLPSATATAASTTTSANADTQRSEPKSKVIRCPSKVSANSRDRKRKLNPTESEDETVTAAKSSASLSSSSSSALEIDTKALKTSSSSSSPPAVEIIPVARPTVTAAAASDCATSEGTVATSDSLTVAESDRVGAGAGRSGGGGVVTKESVSAYSAAALAAAGGASAAAAAAGGGLVIIPLPRSSTTSAAASTGATSGPASSQQTQLQHDRPYSSVISGASAAASSAAAAAAAAAAVMERERYEEEMRDRESAAVASLNRAGHKGSRSPASSPSGHGVGGNNLPNRSTPSSASNVKRQSESTGAYSQPSGPGGVSGPGGGGLPTPLYLPPLSHPGPPMPYSLQGQLPQHVAAEMYWKSLQAHALNYNFMGHPSAAAAAAAAAAHAAAAHGVGQSHEELHLANERREREERVIREQRERERREMEAKEQQLQRERERENWSKQAVDQHFEESLRKAQEQKRNRDGGGLSAAASAAAVRQSEATERQFVELQYHQDSVRLIKELEQRKRESGLSTMSNSPRVSGSSGGSAVPPIVRSEADGSSKQAVDQHFHESLRMRELIEQKKRESALPSGSSPWSLPRLQGDPMNKNHSALSTQAQLSLNAGPPSHNHNSGGQDKDNRERFMAAYNQVIERHAGNSSGGSGNTSGRMGNPVPPPNSTSSNNVPPTGSSSGPGNPYTALPRADLNFQGYQTAPSPTSQGPVGSQPPQRKSEQSLNSNSNSSGNHHLVADYSVKSGSSGGGVIVGPGDRMDRDPRDHLQQIHQARALDMQRMADLRDTQRGDPQQQRPPAVSYKPYESTPRSVSNSSSSGSGPVGNRTSRSPHSQMIPPTTTSSNYQNHYAGPGPGSQQAQHSYSPNPGGRNGPSASYMPPPSVSPSRSPATVAANAGPPAHSALYPAMRYSPAPQTTAPAPSTSPSDPNRAKKTSPSPLQQQQHQHVYLNSSSSSTSRSSSNSGMSISSGPPVCRADQTTPLSLTTPAKLITTIPYNPGVSESAPPPAHTARNERELRDAREIRDVRLYPNTAFSPLAHPLPPPHLSVNSTARSGQPPVQLPIVVPQQQQPLDLGTYREDSPIPLISSARLSTAEVLAKKTRADQQQAPPPPSIPHMPGYPSIGPTGFALGGAPLMSVAALIDAGFSTASVNKPQSNSASNAAAYALSLSSRHPPCDTPPLLLQPNPSLPPMSHGAPPTEPRPVIVKNEPLSSTITPPKAINISPPPAGNEPPSDRASGSQNASRSPPVIPEVKVKQEPVSQPLPPPPPNNKNNTNNSAKPVHKLKTAWLQRHTGGDDVVIKPTIDIKIEPMDRNSPGLAKPNARKAAASAGNIKTESINGYGSPQNANDDDSNTTGLRGGAGGNKRKSRGPAASSVPKDRDKRAKTSATTAAASSSTASAPVQTPASSTGGSSSDDASESENDVNGGMGRQKKGGAAVKSNARGINALAGRQRNSDSSSSSKDGQSMRKGRGGAVSATGSNSKPVVLPVNPFNKPPIQNLKKSGQSFLQDLPCWEIAPRLSKCRECRLTPHQRRRNEQQQTNANIFCRFYAFRRLRYTKNSQIAIAGFSDPVQDASEDDLKLWLPIPEKASVQEPDKTSPLGLDAEMAIFLLTHAGDQFCYMVQTEKEAKTDALASVTEDGDPLKIAWKRVVQGVREMCDVCETTLFNFHWACGKCGYVVCIDCYKSRRAAKSPHNGNGTSGKDDEKEEKDKDRDSYGWLLCTSRSGHDPDKLMPTQIIAGKALECMGHLVHSYRRQHSIIQFCDCPEAIESNKAIEAAAATNSEANGTNGSGDSNGISKNPNTVKTDALPNGDIDSKGNSSDVEGSKSINGNQTSSAAGDVKGGGQSVSSPLSVLAELALSKDKKAGKPKNGYGKAEGGDGTAAVNGADGDLDQTTSDEENGEHFSTLRELLIRPAPKTVTKTSDQTAPPVKRPRMETLEDVISCVIERGVDREASTGSPVSNPPSVSADSVPVPLKESVNTNGETEEVKEIELLHFKRHVFKTPRTRGMLPVRIMILADSERAYPGVPHSWLCNGRLLQLHDPSNPGNSKLFQDSWRRGQPVLVSGVSKLLDHPIWHPDSFLKEFGDDKNDLVNCLTGNLVPNQSMKKFWEGFERLTKRLKDDKGQPMLLKLKDWPPGEDFAELLPDRFADLMKALPLSDYTHRSGRLNLAGRLPECFVRPDLGPKMYNAYGSALLCTKGTTNLHLDVSDAANVMVYIGLPKEANSEEHIKEAIKAVEDSGCDFLTRQRIEKGGEIPGALWHIYQASDADKIRDFLNKVALERGDRLEIHNDPIHDQSWYLDGELRGRLYKEYGVSGYPIVQCLGDTIFIPAGAPHQVRNLHSCIKVAEDFVSPETVAHCFQMTQEFRHLSDSHTNHEDKLQIKNIIYHAMKDSIAALAHANNVSFPDLLRVYDSFITN